MSNKSRHRRLLFMMGLVLFSLLGSIWISSNNGMTVYADSKTNITQNGTGTGTVINQQEEPQVSTVNSNTTDNTSSSDDQTSQKQVTNTEAQPRAPADNNQPVQEDRNYISNSQYSTSNSGANTNQGPSVNSISKSNSSPSAYNKGTSVDITISNSKLTTNSIEGGFGTTEFKFDFSVPDSAKSGDTTTISLPDQLDFQRSQKFNIYAPDGKTVVATAVIDKPSKSLVLTYTDYVDSHDSISGHIDMQVTAATSEVNKEETIPAEIKINGHTVTIDSSGIKHRPSRGDTATDFWKYGYVDYDKNEVVYHVNINASMQSVSNVVISDSLVSDGFSYVPGSFSISKGNWERNSENYWTLSNPQDVTNQYNIDINSSNSAYTVKLGNISEGYAIVYRVKSNHPLLNGEQVVNNVNYESNKKVINSSKNTVYYQGASGKANGYNHSLTINKEDESGAPLANAVFSVIRKSTNGVVGTITTGPDGKGTIYGLLKDDYIIRETSAPSGYTLAKDVTVSADSFDSKGATATITDKKAVTTVSGTKTWKDNDDQDGKRPDSIKVNLLANGKVVQSKTVKASDNWKYSFTNLPEFENGQKITYTVTEDAVAGYTSTIDGYNITNNHTPATVKVSGTKTWNDNNNQDGIRPSSITVNLLANGRQVASKTVSASDNWQYSFDNLAAYANGQKITYTVTENAVAGYTSTVDGYNVTNNHTPATVKVSGTKTWNDNNNQDGIRPSSITVNLLANGRQVASKTVSASDNWQYSFDNLAAYANGQKITYTVTENAVAGYTSTVDGYNVTNNHTPATVKVSGTKTWNDNNNQDGIRPSSITVNLLANGRQVASKTVSASDNWQYSFDNLAAYANGQKITYTVTENAVAGYTSTVDGYNVTNNHTPATVKVSGTKTWNDNNNQDGIRPSSITVNLLANGRQVASKTVSASDNWQYSFDNLAAYANGQKITYTVTENAVAGYTSTVDGYNITNTHNPTTPKKPQVPNSPTTPKEPQVPNNGNKVIPKAYTQGKTYEKTGKLPQTGNESSMGMMLIGLVTLLLSLGLVVISRFTI
ncbi:collagen-binding protein cbp (plasmid) [Limosilactobacillus fermentum 3872]|uniref:Collagen-binding protein n=5 Tax=Lactobacillaceae TaxID=33958 RepID=A0A837EL39_LIMFE|nr:collagen-binding protein [Limosilactobacillus fermentum]KIR12943.1 collagen-binding protein cbp [Limosilactobacillus fermentum 3872]